MKKGMIEVQFNWIFILIVGAMILMFFISMTYWYKTNEEKKLAGDVLTKIQTIMTGAGVNDNTASKIDIPRIELQFFCDTDCNAYGCPSSFEFEETGVSRDTTMDILFTQNSFKSDFIYSWTLEWNMPYKVVNFLYFSSPGAKFYLVYEDGNPDSQEFAQKVNDLMESNKYMIPKLISGSEVGSQAYKNEHFVRFVYFFEPATTQPVSESMRKGKTWGAIFVSGDVDSGTVKWGEVTGATAVPDTEYVYFGLESLIGAIYSEDDSFYRCNMKKAFLKLRAVNEIHKLKSEKLFNHYAGDLTCEFYYDAELIEAFDHINTALQDLEDPDRLSIMNAISIIKDMNLQTDLKSCTKIY